MKRICIAFLALVNCVVAFSQVYSISPAHTEVCGGDVVTYTINPQYYYPSLFKQYDWFVEGGKFANGQTRYTVTDVWTRTAVVTWSSTPQGDDAYLRCEVELVSTDHIAYIEPAIYAVPKPDPIDQANANGEIIVLTSSSSVALSTGSDEDWWVDDYKWVFDPTSGTTDTYFPGTASQSISLNQGLENGTISVQSYNDHCDDLSEVRSATIKRKFASPTWNSSPPNRMCNYNTATISINSVPSADYYTWETTGGIYINEYGSPTTKTGRITSLTIKAPSTGSGTGTVSVTAKKNGVISSDPLVKEIWIGVPPKPSTSPTESEIFEMELGDDDGFYVTSGPQATSYLWTISGSIMATSGTTSSYVFVTATSLGEGDWTVRSVNECGQGIAATGLVDVVLSGDGFLGPLSVYPIPANSFLILEADETKFDTSKESLDLQLSKLANGAYFRIIDKFGTVKLTQVYNGERKVQINTSTLDPGLYTLQLVSKEGNYSVNISISR